MDVVHEFGRMAEEQVITAGQQVYQMGSQAGQWAYSSGWQYAATNLNVNDYISENIFDFENYFKNFKPGQIIDPCTIA